MLIRRRNHLIAAFDGHLRGDSAWRVSAGGVLAEG
jgi:hypothetical protein